MSIFNFTVQVQDRTAVSLSEYKGSNQFAKQAPGSDEEIFTGGCSASCADQLAKAVRTAYETEKST